MAVLNSNPEILLKKRKDADRKRADKQQEDLDRKAKRAKLNRKKKFIRAETLVSNFKSNELERKRVRALSKKQERLAANPLLLSSPTDTKYKLLFIIRVPNHTKGLSIPPKARQVLEVLKLTDVNTGVFVKASDSTMNLLNLVAPYIIIGKPSLSSIRKLFQKRARILTFVDVAKSEDKDETAQETSDAEIEKKAVPTRLDNNQVVEEEFGDSLGLVCIEDIIHEIAALSENFITITKWLMPFKLNPPVNGWGPVAKLAKMVHAEDNKTKISLSQDFQVSEVDDIDSVIDQQN